MRTLLRTVALVIALALLLAAWGVRSAWARDAFVMLSGGDSPMNNNYSQYLQAKAVTAYFLGSYPGNSVWVFFGAGNVAGQKPVLADVLREKQRDDVLVDSWTAGALPQNRPATREVVLRALREEILPTVADGGTLYLFVGDHGSRTEGKDAESIIDLWGMQRDAASEHGWSYNDDESLGVAELRQVLAKGIGKGRVVFCMTQCHAGGFHYLAIPHEMMPDVKWFTAAPRWAKRGRAQVIFPPAAGFTATDEFSLAAGCDPAPDPADWAGYERFLPENLLGVNLYTLQRTRGGLRSFAEAHDAATLVDRTIDKPRSTSDQFLERWAELIETRLAREPNLSAKAKNGVANYQRAVNGAAADAADAAFQERRAMFGAFIEKMCKQNSEVGQLLRTGTRKELEAVINPLLPMESQNEETPMETRPRRHGGRRGGRTRRPWSAVIRPAWEAAVDANEVTNLPMGAREFEKRLLKQEEEDGQNYFSPGGRESLTDEIYWQSGYSDPQTLDTAKAEAVALWGAERRIKIIEWAKASDDGDVRAAAEELSRIIQPGGTAGEMNMSTEPMDAKTAAERTLFYRRVLAAWGFLIEMNERPALARLRELIGLERTPLPPPK
jgi:hypothetical protein